MEHNSNTRFAALQTCCHTCRQPIPVSKSTYNTVSAPDVDIDSPPQYSALDSEVKVPQTISEPEWKFSLGRHKHWNRTIEHGDERWSQYGISQQQSDGEPDFFFTCKNMLRKGKNGGRLQAYCVVVASAMRMHRDDDFHRCGCDFENWRRWGGSGGCRVSWYHLNTRFMGYMVGRAMERHDQWCSCGCFDVKSEDSTTSGQ